MKLKFIIFRGGMPNIERMALFILLPLLIASIAHAEVLVEQRPSKVVAAPITSPAKTLSISSKKTDMNIESQIDVASTALKDISSRLESIRIEMSQPPKTSVAIYIQIFGILAAMVAAFISAAVSSVTALTLAKQRERDEKRHFCLNLQSQFDSPQMFVCRFKAWQQLNAGAFNGVTKVSDLLTQSCWTQEVSTIIHFFESLNRYCDEDLIDPILAAKLFGRVYEMWYQKLLNQLEIDEVAEPYRGWYEGILAFQKHVERAQTA